MALPLAQRFIRELLFGRLKDLEEFCKGQDVRQTDCQKNLTISKKIWEKVIPPAMIQGLLKRIL